MNKPNENKVQDNLCHNCPNFGNCPLQTTINEKPHQCMRALQAFMLASQKRIAENLRRAEESNRKADAINAETMKRLQRLAEHMEKTERERIEKHYRETDLTRVTPSIYYKDFGPGFWWISGRVVELNQNKPTVETVCKRKDLPRLAMVPLKRKTRVLYDDELIKQLRLIGKN